MTDPTPHDRDDTAQDTSAARSAHSGTNPFASPEPSATPPAQPPEDFSIPDDITALTDKFGHLDYANISDSGRKKLVDSQVGPLVAVARGYESVFADDIARIEQAIADPSDSASTKRIRHDQINRALSTDAMVLPWYGANQVRGSVGDELPATTIQIRPSTPISTGQIDNTGASATKKYDNLIGADTVVDIHPATPTSWIEDPTVPVIFTEGIIKADSTLTALLLETLGADALDIEPLGLDGEDAATIRAAARADLRSKLASLPASRRFVLLSAVGVANWKRESWSSVKLSKGRQFHVAFDGDLARNRNVWQQARRLWDFAEKQGANVTLIDLTCEMDGTEPSTGGGKVQLGLDDFFGAPRYRTFTEVTSRLLGALPQLSGAVAEMIKGAWRIAPDGQTTQECVEVEGDDESKLVWTDRIGYGARVTSINSRLAPTMNEMEDGIRDTRRVADSEDQVVEIEFSWMDPVDDAVRTATVSGNGELLTQTPANWTRYAAAQIPPELGMHPEWPPRAKLGEAFLSAVKANNPQMVESRIAWDAMGWVPGKTGPVFLIGDQVFPVDESVDQESVSAVTESTLWAAGRFGLPESPITEEDSPQEAEAKAIAIIKEVFELFLGRLPGVDPDDQPIRREEYGAVLLLAGVRPLIPVRSGVTLYLYGPPGKGKSYCGGLVTSFWQKYPGAFGEGNLPGSAADTFASTEMSLARTPVWLMDDVAPQASRHAAESQQTQMEQLVRAVFNGHGKGRSDKDLRQRATHQPRAMFVVTGEVEPSVPSIRQRSIMMHMDGTVLGDAPSSLDPLDRMRNETNLAGTFARLCLDAIILRIRDIGYAQRRHPEQISFMEDMANLQRNMTAGLKEKIGGKDSSRPAQIGADLLMASGAIHAIGCTYIQSKNGRQWLREVVLKDLIGHVRDVSKKSTEDQRQHDIGANLINAARSLLSTGEAYIADPVSPNLAPLKDDGQELSNRNLGWETSMAHVQGAVPIGTLYRTEAGEDEAIVLLDYEEAFRLARSKRTDLVPAGTSKTASWSAAWDAGIPVADRWSRMKDSKSGASKAFVQVQINGTRRNFVPIRLAKILGREPLQDVELLAEQDAREAEALG